MLSEASITLEYNILYANHGKYANACIIIHISYDQSLLHSSAIYTQHLNRTDTDSNELLLKCTCGQ